MPKKDYGWLAASLVFSLGWAVIYFDRMMFTPIMDSLAADYGLAASDIGFVFSLFFLGYTLLQIPGGILGDKIGVGRVIHLTFLGMAAISLMNGMFSSFIVFLILRFLAGAFEGLYYGPQFSLSSSTINLRYRVFATTIINSGMSVGIILGTTLPVALVASGFDYKWLYAVVAAMSLSMGLLLKKFMPRAPEKAVKETLFKPNKELLIIFFVSFCSLYCFFNILTWLQHYLAKEKFMDAETVAACMMLISGTSIFSALVFGRLIDKFNAIKKFTIGLIILAAASVVVLVNAPDSSTAVWAVAAYGAFGKMALDPILIIAVARANKDSSLSTTLSVFNFVGLVSSVIAPFTGGLILKYTGSLDWSFYLSALILCAALAGSFMFRKDEPFRHP